MSTADWDRVNDLFHRALASWNGAEDLLAAETPEVRAEVRRMLAAHQALENTTDEPGVRRGRTVAGRYRLERLLGSGGSGEAWLSIDSSRDAPVVVKIPHYWAWFRADVKRRFEEEAHSLRQIRHEAIVSVLEAGEAEDGAPFLVMPYIDGEPLRALLDRGPLPVRLAASIAEQLGSAVEAAHKAGIIHRDIKPENLIVRMAGGSPEISLIDFGIAMFSELDEYSSTTTRFFGTTQYMAPEQLLAKPSPASDVYAMALVIYETAVGRPLFAAMTPAALYEAQRKLSEADLALVPPRMRRLLMAALNPNPRKRTGDARQFGLEAAACLRNPGPRWLPSRRALLASGATALVAGAWTLRSYRPLLDSERHLDYQGGETFRQVGWTQFAQIDSDMVELNAQRTAYIGNRVVSRSQGGYWYPFSDAIQKHAFHNRWRMRSLLRPVHGFLGVTVTLAAAGLRYTCEFVAPDQGPVRVEVVHRILPHQEVTKGPLDLSAAQALIPVEMQFDPATKMVRATAGDRLITTRYQGCRQFLDFPGIALAVGQLESEIGEGVLGDLHFEIT